MQFDDTEIGPLKASLNDYVNLLKNTMKKKQ